MKVCFFIYDRAIYWECAVNVVQCTWFIKKMWMILEFAAIAAYAGKSVKCGDVQIDWTLCFMLLFM